LRIISKLTTQDNFILDSAERKFATSYGYDGEDTACGHRVPSRLWRFETIVFVLDFLCFGRRRRILLFGRSRTCDLCVFCARQARNILFICTMGGVQGVPYVSAGDLGILKCDFDVKLSNPPGHVPAYHMHTGDPRWVSARG